MIWGIKHFQTSNWGSGVKINDKLYWCWFSKNRAYDCKDKVNNAIVFNSLNDAFKFKQQLRYGKENYWYEVAEIDLNKDQK